MNENNIDSNSHNKIKNIGQPFIGFDIIFIDAALRQWIESLKFTGEVVRGGRNTREKGQENNSMKLNSKNIIDINLQTILSRLYTT